MNRERKDGSGSVLLHRLRNNGYFHLSYLGISELRDRVWSHFIGKKLGAKGLRIGSGYYIRGLNHIHIGENFNAGKGLWLEALTKHLHQNFSPSIEIGDNVSISFWGHIAAAGSISIGSGVMIGSKVTIIDHNHGEYGSDRDFDPELAPAQRSLSLADIRIGRNVWIADGVVVTAGSDIGEGSVVGANSVVRGKIPPFTLAVGIPARPVKTLIFESRRWVKASS
jgi:lipopolysaccharide O-acetyltransferase